MLAADGSLNAHHGAVGRHSRAAKDALGPTVGEPLRAHEMAQRLLAGGRVGNGNKVQDVHRINGAERLTLQRGDQCQVRQMMPVCECRLAG